jgi:hypothetical protein
VKLVPLIVSVAVAGKEFTEVGLMLQLPAPKVVMHASVTVPLKPSCDAIEIGPLIPLLPTFTSGNAPGSPSTKSGFAVTFSVNDAVKVEGAPAVDACMVTG